MNDINLATCWSGLGRARGADRARLLGGDGERLWGLRGQTVQRLPTFSSVQGLANVAHAVGKLRPSGSAWVIMWNELERAALQRAMEFKPQELTNILWAFATAAVPAPQLFDALAALAAEGASTFNAQDLANAAWSLATASHEAPRLFDSICAEAAPRLRAPMLALVRLPPHAFARPCQLQPEPYLPFPRLTSYRSIKSNGCGTVSCSCSGGG